MADYRVSFFSVDRKEVVGSTGKREVEKSYQFVGTLVVDDYGVDDKTCTLASKAYRSAPDKFLRADKLLIEKV